MSRDRDDKEKFKAPKKPVCAGCLKPTSGVLVRPDWCVDCWPASPRPR